MAKKLINGYTAWILTGLAAIAFVAAPVIWAVRAEGKIEVNKTNINHVAEDIGEIKDDIKIILEKL